MKKLKIILLILLTLSAKGEAQNFSLSNPVLHQADDIDFLSFELRVTDSYKFSNDDQSNSSALLTISFGKLKPIGSVPKGNGADLFDWKKIMVTQKGEKEVYSWVGKTMDTEMIKGKIYKLTFQLTKLKGNAAGRLGKEQVLLTAQFTDPADITSGDQSDNNIVIRNDDFIKNLN